MTATLAIVGARLRVERRGLALSCAAAAVAGFLAPHAVDGAALFCGLIGIALALAQGPGRHPHLDVCERGAPLFGRQLARAKATVPCAAALLALVAYWLAQTAAGRLPRADEAVVAFASVIATTLVALSATIRLGTPRLLYVGLACAATANALALATVSTGASVALSAAVAFFALRQYGEALARYDPVT